VFLLACNTLATKDQDKRTPADYLAVLRNHGFEEADAERVVAIRYGPLGQTFRETTRRIFADVPRLYGFSTVAARGERTAVQLEVSALRIELAQVAERLGWMTPEEFRLLASDGVRQLLVRRLTSELVDVTCAITQHEPVGGAFRSADLPDVLFQRAEGLRLVA